MTEPANDNNKHAVILGLPSGDQLLTFNKPYHEMLAGFRERYVIKVEPKVRGKTNRWLVVADRN
jgi:hypothetical protein